MLRPLIVRRYNTSVRVYQVSIPVENTTMPNTPSGAIHGGDETSLHRASTGTEEVSAPEDNAPQVAFPPVATMTGQSGNTPSVEDLGPHGEQLS